MDDILIHAPDQATHNQHLREVLQHLREVLQCLRELLQHLREAGVTRNKKCEFSKTSIKFLGHIIDAKGIHVDLDMVKAIRKFLAPTNITELQRFMGMVNQLMKFIPSLADSNAPLRHLLCKDTMWVWDQPQQSAFEQIKELLTSPPVLVHYDPKRPTVIAADASNTGIGAVLLQT